MHPRHASDYRTLFWALALFPAAPGLAYALPATLPWLWPFSFYLSYCAGVLTHYHTHVPVFHGRRQNRWYSAWLSIFYGTPVAFWIPTHQLNHHRYENGPEDVTRTHRRGSVDGVFQLVAYVLSCGRWQLPLVVDYARRVYAQRGWRWLDLRAQCVAIGLAHPVLAALAVAVHGPALGLAVYGVGFALPALLAPSFMFFTNYIQHVGCQPGPHNHSRNFTSPLSNWFVFDAGFHTVHHEHPNVHWSQYAALHRARAAAIDPALEQTSVLSFCLERYVVARFRRHERVPEGASG
jgi:beta-carotene hydroxylase